MPNAKSNSTDLDTLQMALVGYQIEKQKIENKIAELQARLKGKKVAAATAGEAPAAAPKRILSPAARKRIAAAQKKRWAEHRKKKAAAQAKEA
jgi:cell division septum initiation protein DivIVA